MHTHMHTRLPSLPGVLVPLCLYLSLSLSTIDSSIQNAKFDGQNYLLFGAGAEDGPTLAPLPAVRIGAAQATNGQDRFPYHRELVAVDLHTK